METATGQTTLANKRIRFDATAQAGSTITSPLTLAIGHIQSHTVSLLPEIQAIFNKLGSDYIKLRQRVDHKNRRIQKMASDHEYIPNSARLKFELRVSSDAQLDPDFTTLLDETNALRDQYQQDFKNKVLQAAELEHKVLKAQAAELMASSLFTLAKTHLIASGHPDLDPHRFINTILDRNHETVLLHLEDNLDSFRTLYKTKNRVAGLPDPFPASDNVARHPRNTAFLTQPPDPNIDLPAPPLINNYHELEVMNMARTVDAIFIRSWIIYLDAVTANERRLAIKKIHTELNTTEATDNAQMDIDDQPTMDSHTITDLINQKTSQQNKPMRSDITQIKKQLNSLLSDSKNPSRGQSGASRKKQNANQKKKAPKQNRAGQKAADADNDSTLASATKSHKTSNKKSKGKPAASNTRNRKRSPRSKSGSS
jgi:hypothetical protein